MTDSQLRPRYRIPKAEGAMNKVIGFIYYYRLAFVLLFLIIILILSYLTWDNSPSDNKIRDVAAVMACASIIIGIAYAIINYEHNEIRFKHDKQQAKDILTFNTASEMHRVELISHFRKLNSFYALNCDLLKNSKFKEFEQKMELDSDCRASYIIVFNYFETMSIGVHQGVIDEIFLKCFFQSLISELVSNFGQFIEYLQKEKKAPRMFKNFMDLAKRWEKEKT